MPSEFIGQLLELGVARVSRGSYLYCDEWTEDYRIEDAQGRELRLPHAWKQALFAVVYQHTRRIPNPGGGWQTWDFESNTVLSTGRWEDWNDAGHKLTPPFKDVPLIFELATAPLERGPNFFRPYLHHRAVQVRLALAQNPYLNADLLEPLLCDLESGVMAELMIHPAAPDLVARRKILVRQLETAQDPFQLPRDLEPLANSVWWTVRAAVAANPSASSSTLLRLSQDPLEGVRLALCTNPNCPPDLRKAVLNEIMNANFLGGLLKYSLVPVEVLEKCKKHAALEVAQHPCTPPEILLEILGEVWNHWDDKGLCTLNIEKPQAHTARRLGDEATRPFFEACVRARGTLSLEEQLELARSVWPRVRAELALNPEVSTEVLQSLILDSHDGVSEAARLTNRKPRPGRTLEQQWALLEGAEVQSTDLNVRKPNRLRNVLLEPEKDLDPSAMLHTILDIRLLKLLDGTPLEPGIALEVWNRFGAPSIPELLKVPTLLPSLREELTIWLKNHPVWREKLGLRLVNLEQPLLSEQTQLASLIGHYKDYFLPEDQEFPKTEQRTLEQWDAQIDFEYQRAQQEFEELRERSKEVPEFEANEEKAPVAWKGPDTLEPITLPAWLEQAGANLLNWMGELDRSADWSGWLEWIRKSVTVERIEPRVQQYEDFTLEYISYDDLEDAIRAADTPERLLKLTLHAKVDYFVGAFLEHEHCTPAVLEGLAKRLYPYKGVREKLVQHEGLLGSSVWSILQNNGGRQNLLELAQNHLALSSPQREAVKAMLEAHQTEALPVFTSPEALDEITHFGRWAAWSALEHPQVSAVTVQRCTHHSDVDIALMALRHDFILDGELLECIWNKIEFSHSNSRSFLPGQVLLERALGHIVGVWVEYQPEIDTEDKGVWARAMQIFTHWLEGKLNNPDTSPALLVFAVSALLHFISPGSPHTDNPSTLSLTHSAFSLERLKRIVLHPNTPESVLELLSVQWDGKYLEVRGWVAAHPKLSDKLAGGLMRDPAPEVLVALAQNPVLSSIFLERLSQDESSVVREAAEHAKAHRART